MEKFDLQIFCTNWNKSHIDKDEIQFYPEISKKGNLVNVVIRYPKRTHGETVYSSHWFAITASVDTLSNGAMIISSTRGMSKNGILEFSILTSTDGYDPKKVADTLEWIASIIDPTVTANPASTAAR